MAALWVFRVDDRLTRAMAYELGLYPTEKDARAPIIGEFVTKEGIQTRQRHAHARSKESHQVRQKVPWRRWKASLAAKQPRGWQP
eukprot:1538395-Lingulodinium_polyedra.AAC.1